MGEEAEKPVDSQTHVCFLFPGSREPLKDRWVLEGEVWGQREDGLEGRLRRNESDVNSTDVCPGPPGSQALRRGLRVEGERETGDVSARSSELGSWPGPPTSEAAALLPPAPLPHPHLVIVGHRSLWPRSPLGERGGGRGTPSGEEPRLSPPGSSGEERVAAGKDKGCHHPPGPRAEK